MADLDTSIAIKIIDAFSAPLRALQKGFSANEAQASRLQKAVQFAGNLNQAGEAAGRFGRAIIEPAKNAVKSYADFEQKMIKVAALTGDYTKTGFKQGYADLTAQAEKLGAETKYTSEQVADSMGVYAQAGKQANEIAALMPQTLAAATANAESLDVVAETVLGVMSGMRIPVEDTAKTIDMLSKAGVMSRLTISDLGQAFATIAPAATAMNLNLVDTLSYLAQLRDGGMDASRAAHGLQTVLAALADARGPAQEALASIGIDARQLTAIQGMVATGKLTEALKLIDSKLSGVGPAKRAQVEFAVFGREGMPSVGPMMELARRTDDAEKSMAKYRSELQNSTGATLELAGVMERGLSGALERAGGATDSLNRSIGKVLAPMTRNLAGDVEELAGSMEAWTKKHPDATRTLAVSTAALGGLAIGVQGMSFAISTGITAVHGITTAFKFMAASSLLGPAGLIVAAGATGLAIGKLINETTDWGDRLRELLGLQEKRDAFMDPKSDRQQMGNGWEISKKTGEVISRGTGPSNYSEYDEAIRSGLTHEQANAQIKLRRSMKGQEGFRVDKAAFRSYQPKRRLTRLEQDAEQTPLSMMEAPKVEAPSVVRAIQEQTTMMREAMTVQSESTRSLSIELQRRGLAPLQIPGMGNVPGTE